MVPQKSRTALALAAVAAALAPTGALAASTTTGPSAGAAPAIAGGWGSVPSYIGTFTVTAASGPAPTPVSSPGAGVFSLAVRTAAQLGAASGPVSTGQLVTFLRKVKSTEPLAPSGILSLFGASGSRILYLTDLARHGSARVATVDGGSFLGVPIGTFTATPGPEHSLRAVINARGLGAVHVRLGDFTAAPQSS